MPTQDNPAAASRPGVVRRLAAYTAPYRLKLAGAVFFMLASSGLNILRHAPRDRADLVGVRPHQPGVVTGAHGRAVGVEEAQAHVADGALRPQLDRVLRRRHIPRLAQQGRGLHSTSACMVKRPRFIANL